MAVTDREFAALTSTVQRLGERVDALETVRDEARGAAREASRVWARILAGVGIFGMLGQLLIAYFTSGGHHP